MKIQRILFILLILTLTATIKAQAAGGVIFCDKSPAKNFLETGLQFLIGGSAQTQNYTGCFNEVREVNTSMGTAWGVGATATFGIRGYLALGTELNIVVNNNRTDIATSNDNATSVSNIFLRNRYYYANIPVYMSFRFNLAPKIRWDVDAGLYYSYGFGGSQRQTVYNSQVNALGELVNRVVTTKPSFFNNSATFINEYYRGDIGLHLATGLTVARRYRIGVRSQIGMKNISHTSGLVNPRIHNINLMLTLGYHF
ncbi:MAG: PorT family protein [Clostridium sp.]|nr:PorT family protein [Clostridium sp.]